MRMKRKITTVSFEFRSRIPSPSFLDRVSYSSFKRDDVIFNNDYQYANTLLKKIHVL